MGKPKEREWKIAPCSCGPEALPNDLFASLLKGKGRIPRWQLEGGRKRAS
jgi:hypothetical protein